MTTVNDAAFRTDDKKNQPDDKKDAVEPKPGAATHIGDGAHNDTSGGGAHETSEDAFRAAIGLESGNKGNTNYTAEQFSRDVGRGSGISPGQIVKYTGADGQEIQGGQYHNKEGTFFKTPGTETNPSETYKVQADGGKYTLVPTKEGQQPIEATQRNLVSNNFAAWTNRPRDNDGSNNGGANSGGDNSGGTGNGNGRHNRTNGDAVPASDKAPAAATTAVPGDKAAIAPAVAPEKVVAAAATTLGGDHVTPTAPLASASGTRLDPTTFYNTFKGGSDQQQRDLLTSSLSAIPREQRPDFIKQVTEVAIKTDRANAGDVLQDLRQTARSVRGQIDNPNATTNPTVSDKPVAVTPVAAIKADIQPAIAAAVKDLVPPRDTSGNQPAQPVNLGQLGQFGRDRDRDRSPGTNDGAPQIIKANPGGGDSAPVFVKPGGPEQRVITSVEGQIIKDGGKGQIPGGDSFKPDLSHGIPGQPGQGGLDAAAIVAKLQNAGAPQPGDRAALGGDGKQFQPVQVTPVDVRGHGPGDGKDNPGVQIAARLGGDQAQPVLPQQKNLIPGLDLHDPQTKQFLADALKQIQATKVGDFDPRGQNQNLQDILKGFDPHKVERLQAFLNPDGKGPISDAAVGKLASILTQSDRPVTGTAATDITLGQRTAIDRLTELVRGNQNLIDLQTLQTKDGRLLQEINRMVGDVNKQFGFEGKNVLSLSDIIGRSLDAKAGERGLGLEGKSALVATNLDPLSFTARMTPQQEQAIRAFLDMKDARLASDLAGKTAALDTHAGILRPADMLTKNEPGTKFETNVRAELANKNEQRVDAKHEPTAKELAARELPNKELSAKELSAKDMSGKPEGKQEVSGKELGLKPELAVKAELANKSELAGKQDVVRSEQIIRPDIKDKDDRGDKLDSHMPFGKHDNTIATNLDGSKKVRDEKELAEKQKDEKERLEEDQQRREAALLALIADRKIREDKEKQQKEQEKPQEKKQDEDARRRRYVVRERDTLESIATKQHRDGKLAPLIHELNQKEIVMKIENGREVPDLRARQVIWLPSGVDIREYRKRMSSGSSSQRAGDENLTAEDELSARFGSNWGGTTSGSDTANGGVTSSPSSQDLTPEAVAAAQSRRANIEKLLGPLSKQKAADGRIRYVVRLGDTLKTVAMKHPSLQDISLWPLLAEVNEISVETDDKGIPQAKLSRGSTMMIPTIEEIQLYRDQHGSRASASSKATKPCPQCGRLSTLGASLCGACAHSFNLDSKPANVSSDAGMVVMQAAGFVQKPGVPLIKRPAPPDTVELESPQIVIPAPLYPDGEQVAVVQLDEQTRLTRCMIHGENPSTVVVVEVSRDDVWKAVVAYEIFSQSSMRHEYNPRGERKSVRIDLPTEAILELSNNDLKTNWKNYRDRYFAQLISLNR